MATLLASFAAFLAAAGGSASSWVDPREEVASALRNLHAGTEHDRYWATVKLGRYPDDALHARRDLVAALSDPAPRVRAGAATALEYFGRRARESWIVSPLATALHDASPRVRAAAAFALGSVGGKPRPTLLDSLATCATDAVPETEVACAFALRELFPDHPTPAHASQAIELLFVSLQNEDGLRAVRFANAAAVLSPDAAASSVDRLVQRYYSGTRNASYALESYRPILGNRVSRWRAALSSASESGRVSAARTLGLMRDPDPTTVSLLRKHLRDSQQVSRASAEALGRIGPAAAAATADLASLVRSRDGSLRETAAWALIGISPEAARKAAAELRRTDPSFAKWFEVRIALSEL